MKTALAAAAAASVAALTTAAIAAPAPFTVTIDGVEARGGTLFVTVQTEGEFMAETGTDGSMIDGPSAGSHTLVYDLEPGDYAVSVWHDDDGDGEFSRADNGWPLDGWALSAPAANGPPSFDDAKVTVTPDGAMTTLSMTYGR